MSLLRRAHGRVVWARRVDVLARHLDELLPPGTRVLDVGSGDGAVAAALVERRPDLDVQGVDVLVRPDTHITVTHFDGRRLPFDDDAFAAVTLVDVLHHVDDQDGLLREARRVAGQVVIKDHVAAGMLDRGVLRLMDWGGNSGLGVSLPYDYRSSGEWAASFQRVGLAPDEERTELGLYPAPLSWAFERSLHAVWTLRRVAPAAPIDGT